MSGITRDMVMAVDRAAVYALERRPKIVDSWELKDHENLREVSRTLRAMQGKEQESAAAGSERSPYPMGDAGVAPRPAADPPPPDALLRRAWSDEARQACAEFEDKYDVEVCSAEHAEGLLKRISLLDKALAAAEAQRNEAVKCMEAGWIQVCAEPAIKHFKEAAEAAEARAQEMEADARRYRWLRDKSLGQWIHPIVVEQNRHAQGVTYVGPLCGSSLDKAIDAALSRHEPEATDNKA